MIIDCVIFVYFARLFYNESSEFPDNSQDTEPGVRDTFNCNRIIIRDGEKGDLFTQKLT